MRAPGQTRAEVVYTKPFPQYYGENITVLGIMTKLSHCRVYTSDEKNS